MMLVVSGSLFNSSLKLGQKGSDLVHMHHIIPEYDNKLEISNKLHIPEVELEGLGMRL